MSFQDDYDQLRTQDKNQFAQTVNNLLFHCYVVRKKFDRTTGMDKFVYDYSFIERHWSLFEEYLNFMDMTLSRDDTTGVIFVRSAEGRNVQRVDTATTLVLYALRIHYEEQLEQKPNNLEIQMDSTTLRQLLSDLGLSTASKRLSTVTVSQALKTLQNFNIVTRRTGSFNDPTYSFYILPSIKFAISNDKLNALYRYLCGDDTEDEPADETSKAEEKPVEEKPEPKADDGAVGPEPAGF